MSRTTARIATFAAASAVTLGAAGVAATVADDDAAAAESAGKCSAASLPAAAPVAGLPKAVSSMRRRIVAAARACDYARLERLGRRGASGFAFSFGADGSAARFWRRAERAGERPAPMAALVKVLDMPRTRDRNGSYVWPSAHRTNPTARDWRALRTLYSRKQIRAMRRGGSGYLGYRLAIAVDGDWQYFVAGD